MDFYKNISEDNKLVLEIKQKSNNQICAPHWAQQYFPIIQRSNCKIKNIFLVFGTK